MYGYPSSRSLSCCVSQSLVEEYRYSVVCSRYIYSDTTGDNRTSDNAVIQFMYVLLSCVRISNGFMPSASPDNNQCDTVSMHLGFLLFLVPVIPFSHD